MNEKNTYPFEIASELNTWMQSMGNFWGTMAKPLDTLKPKPNSPQTEQHTGQKNQDAFAAALKNWQPMVLAMSRIHDGIAQRRRRHAGDDAQAELKKRVKNLDKKQHQTVDR